MKGKDEDEEEIEKKKSEKEEEEEVSESKTYSGKLKKSQTDSKIIKKKKGVDLSE